MKGQTMHHSRTHDRSPTGDRGPPEMQGARLVYTEGKIGPKRELKRNGDLVCFDVPIARAGWMLYGPGEVPVQSNPTSPSLYVERAEAELFDPDTMLSFHGSPVVMGHPDFGKHPKGVTPDNSRELAGGICVNVRRGGDGQRDVLLADLIITRRDFIEAIQSGKREVSAGYDASYETVRPGIGRQTDIIGNHIALVDKGRCGPQCAIGDHDPTYQQEQSMAAEDKGAPARRRFDAATLDAIGDMVQAERRHLTADQDDESGIHVHVHTGGVATRDAAAGKDKDKDKDDDDLGERVGRVEKMCGDMAASIKTIGDSMAAFVSGAHKTKDAATGDAEATAKAAADAAALAAGGDSAALATSYQQLVTKAEVLVPGFKVPTFDSAKPRALTVDSMCALRTSVLTDFLATTDGKDILVGITGDAAPDLKAMDCKEKAVLFNAAASAKASANNAAATRDAHHAAASHQPTMPQQKSISDINAANKKFWDEANSSSQKA